MTNQVYRNENMSKDHLAVGDSIDDSPVGPGMITSITDAGYPRVNHVAVARLTRTDGVVWDPHGSYERDKQKHKELMAKAITNT